MSLKPELERKIGVWVKREEILEQKVRHPARAAHIGILPHGQTCSRDRHTLGAECCPIPAGFEVIQQHTVNFRSPVDVSIPESVLKAVPPEMLMNVEACRICPFAGPSCSTEECAVRLIFLKKSAPVAPVSRSWLKSLLG